MRKIKVHEGLKFVIYRSPEFDVYIAFRAEQASGKHGHWHDLTNRKGCNFYLCDEGNGWERWYV